jgi:hypothetical protein
MPSPVFDPAPARDFGHELARRVQQRLSAELPRIIESTVRDFLAEQEMIRADFRRREPTEIAPHNGAGDAPV